MIGVVVFVVLVIFIIFFMPRDQNRDPFAESGLEEGAVYRVESVSCEVKTPKPSLPMLVLRDRNKNTRYAIVDPDGRRISARFDPTNPPVWIRAICPAPGYLTLVAVEGSPPSMSPRSVTRRASRTPSTRLRP